MSVESRIVGVARKAGATPEKRTAPGQRHLLPIVSLSGLRRTLFRSGHPGLGNSSIIVRAGLYHVDNPVLCGTPKDRATHMLTHGISRLTSISWMGSRGRGMSRGSGVLGPPGWHGGCFGGHFPSLASTKERTHAGTGPALHTRRLSTAVSSLTCH